MQRELVAVEIVSPIGKKNATQGHCIFGSVHFFSNSPARRKILLSNVMNNYGAEDDGVMMLLLH